MLFGAPCPVEVRHCTVVSAQFRFTSVYSSCAQGVVLRFVFGFGMISHRKRQNVIAACARQGACIKWHRFWHDSATLRADSLLSRGVMRQFILAWAELRGESLAPEGGRGRKKQVTSRFNVLPRLRYDSASQLMTLVLGEEGGAWFESDFGTILICRGCIVFSGFCIISLRTCHQSHARLSRAVA